MMLLRGTFVHTPELGQLVILKDHLVSVDADGFIAHFESAISSASKSLIDSSDGHILSIPTGSFVLPTFCDLHLHAPQFLYQGNGLDLPLMQWLDKYTFKAEERIDGDPALARKVYEKLAARLIEHGTGAILLFGTIKEETNLILAQAMQSAGIRAFIGKLSMDISSRPTYVESSAAASLASAESFTQKCAELVRHLPPHRRMVEPVLTPRFVPTCSDELLKGLGKLSEERSLRVQSHMAEAEDLIRWMESERGMKDTNMFDTSNLLTPRTVQAHCTYLSDSELDHVHDTGTSIAHCPLSNVYFSARPFKLREALRSGVKVGLGTDIAGGYSVDVMSAMRQAVVVSRMRESERVTKGEKHDDSLAINWKESLYLATRGGAIALNLPLGTGAFQVGAPFDAQQINVYDLNSGSGIGQLDFFDANEVFEIGEDVVEKWWCIGDTRNRSRMWVQGDVVQPSA
ncbi:hypothetical protein M378DRAFT_129848 [Amanita muscaria Koide BX008]|uniref:Amidohydrolase-related domain-containing protein n=1 Tax=Amanita muscaria (strain Koide BX008) TaxID=946122 RepID=A0A0C2WIM0_AMAMK|nr:hypothetical protein M378DRAFT_129848 [Amanita muscaria Koide BX008]